MSLSLQAVVSETDRNPFKTNLSNGAMSIENDELAKGIMAVFREAG